MCVCVYLIYANSQLSNVAYFDIMIIEFGYFKKNSN